MPEVKDRPEVNMVILPLVSVLKLSRKCHVKVLIVFKVEKLRVSEVSMRTLQSDRTFFDDNPMQFCAKLCQTLRNKHGDCTIVIHDEQQSS